MALPDEPLSKTTKKKAQKGRAKERKAAGPPTATTIERGTTQ